MQIYSYPGCDTCLVKMCCHNVCGDYRQHVRKETGLTIMAPVLKLEDAEPAVALALEREEPAEVIKMGRDKFRVCFALRGVYD